MGRTYWRYWQVKLVLSLELPDAKPRNPNDDGIWWTGLWIVQLDVYAQTIQIMLHGLFNSSMLMPFVLSRTYIPAVCQTQAGICGSRLDHVWPLWPPSFKRNGFLCCRDQLNPMESIRAFPEISGSLMISCGIRCGIIYIVTIYYYYY